METLLILAAVTACAVTGTLVLWLLARGRRAPLRLDSEHDAADEALLLAEIGPSRSPIDRSGAVLDLDPIRAEDPQAPRLGRPDRREDDPR